MKNSSPSRAFTLVELLVVIAIIGVLVGVSFPMLQRMQEQSRKTACLSTIRQIGAGILLYSTDNNMTFPPAGDSYNTNTGGRWTDFVAPYMGVKQNATNTQLDNFLYTTTIYGCPSDKVVRHSSLTVFQKCSYALTYQVQRGDSSGDTPPVKMTAVTHPAETILVAERWDSGNLAHYPLGSSQNLVQTDLTLLGPTATGFHSGNTVSNYAMADGHAETLSSTATTNLWSFNR